MTLKTEFLDLYAILGIYMFASNSDIKKAFRVKAKIFHPDNKETGNSRKFIDIIL